MQTYISQFLIGSEITLILLNTQKQFHSKNCQKLNIYGIYVFILKIRQIVLYSDLKFKFLVDCWMLILYLMLPKNVPCTNILHVLSCSKLCNLAYKSLSKLWPLKQNSLLATKRQKVSQWPSLVISISRNWFLKSSCELFIYLMSDPSYKVCNATWKGLISSVEDIFYAMGEGGWLFPIKCRKRSYLDLKNVISEASWGYKTKHFYKRYLFSQRLYQFVHWKHAKKFGIIRSQAFRSRRNVCDCFLFSQRLIPKFRNASRRFQNMPRLYFPVRISSQVSVETDAKKVTGQKVG